MNVGYVLITLQLRSRTSIIFSSFYDVSANNRASTTTAEMSVTWNERWKIVGLYSREESSQIANEEKRAT